MKRKVVNISQEFLYDRIIKKRCPVADIAEELGLDKATIYKQLRLHSLIRVNETFICSKDFLIEQHITLGLSVIEIAAKIGSGVHIVFKQLKRYGVSPMGNERRIRKSRTKLIGKKFGLLTVTAYSHTVNQNKHTSVYWKCSCDCGSKNFLISSSNIVNEKRPSCGCLRGGPKLKRVGDLSGIYWDSIIRGAKRRNLSFEITQEYAWELFLKQGGKCAFTGVKLKMPPRYVGEKRKGIKNGYAIASLDRIDNKLGYIPGNVQWLSVIQNKLKSSYTEEIYKKECMLNAIHQLRQRKSNATALTYSQPIRNGQHKYASEI